MKFNDWTPLHMYLRALHMLLLPLNHLRTFCGFLLPHLNHLNSLERVSPVWTHLFRRFVEPHFKSLYFGRFCHRVPPTDR